MVKFEDMICLPALRALSFDWTHLEEKERKKEGGKQPKCSAFLFVDLMHLHSHLEKQRLPGTKKTSEKRI